MTKIAAAMHKEFAITWTENETIACSSNSTTGTWTMKIKGVGLDDIRVLVRGFQTQKYEEGILVVTDRDVLLVRSAGKLYGYPLGIKTTELVGAINQTWETSDKLNFIPLHPHPVESELENLCLSSKQ